MTVREHMVLLIEDVRWSNTGPKDTVIRETLGISPVRHAQLVNALIDRGDVEALYPTLVRRLRRIRAARQNVRAKAV